MSPAVNKMGKRKTIPKIELHAESSVKVSPRAPLGQNASDPLDSHTSDPDDCRFPKDSVIE
jgi:hypothetical protein